MVVQHRNATSGHPAAYVPELGDSGKASGAPTPRDDAKPVPFDQALAYVMGKNEELLKRLA